MPRFALQNARFHRSPHERACRRSVAHQSVTAIAYRWDSTARASSPPATARPTGCCPAAPSATA